MHGTPKLVKDEDILLTIEVFYEAQEFYRIIAEKDKDRYEELKSLSIEVQKISNELRHQNGIYFEDGQK
ncbi:hypothetical protein ACWHAM_01985 [Paenibacillus terrae]